MDNLLRFVGAFFLGMFTAILNHPIAKDGTLIIGNCILLFIVLLVWNLAIDFNIHLNKIRKNQMNQKDIENKILREMFGDDSRSYPGFHGIVSTLIENGSCITTETARRMDFFCMTSFIGNRPYKGGVGLIEFYFSTSREEVVSGAEFKRRLAYKKKELGSEIVHLQVKMDEIRDEYDVLSAMLGEE